MIIKWGFLSHIAGKCTSGRLNFWKFSGGACPRTPLEVRAFGPQFYRVPAYSQANALLLQKLMKTLLCAQVHAHHARTYRQCVLEKCFASLHFTDNAVDLACLVSSFAVGLTFKDFLTTLRLVCHVLSTNRSCQTKGPKSKTEHLSAWIVYHTDQTLIHMVGCPLRKFFLPSWPRLFKGWITLSTG